MKTTVLNYRIVVEPDEEVGTGKPCYTAHCPTLEIADFGETIEQALINIKKLIKFHLECLIQEGSEVPPQDKEEGLITNLKVEIPQVQTSI